MHSRPFGRGELSRPVEQTPPHCVPTLAHTRPEFLHASTYSCTHMHPKLNTCVVPGLRHIVSPHWHTPTRPEFFTCIHVSLYSYASKNHTRATRCPRHAVRVLITPAATIVSHVPTRSHVPCDLALPAGRPPHVPWHLGSSRELAPPHDERWVANGPAYRPLRRATCACDDPSPRVRRPPSTMLTDLNDSHDQLAACFVRATIRDNPLLIVRQHIRVF